MHFLKLTAWLVAATMVPLTAMASSVGAHQHGLSNLAIVMEGDRVELQLASPAMNLVGFEHHASTPEEFAAVEKAKASLTRHDALFTLVGGGCQHIKTQLDLSALGSSSAEAEPVTYDHHADHRSARETNHSEVMAAYRYLCVDITALSFIKTHIFKPFAGVQKIHVIWVKPHQQGATTLTPSQRQVLFK